MPEQPTQGASGSFFTKEQIDLARRAGYTDDEIGRYLFDQGGDQIKSALENGATIDQIAESFSVEPIASKQAEEPKQEEGPSAGRIVTGMLANIGITETSKAGLTAAGAYFGAPGGPPGIAFGAGVGYGLGVLTGGVTGSITAQKIEQQPEISWGRVVVDTGLAAVPGAQIAKGPNALVRASAAMAKRPIATAAMLGTVATPAYMAAEELSGSKDYSLTDYGIGAAKGAALGGGFGAASKGVGNLFARYRNKTPEEIDRLIAAGDKSTIETVNILTAGLTPEELATNNQQLYNDLSNFLKSTAGSMAPSRVLGPEATRTAKYAKAGMEASSTQSGALGKRISAYLQKNESPELIQEANDLFSSGRTVTNLLPDNIRQDILEGRNLIREQQQMKLDLHNSGQALLPDGKAEMIEASLNRGDYDTRFYRFFSDSKYKPSAEAAQKLKERLMAGLTDEQKQSRLDKFIGDYRPEKNEVEALRRQHGIAPGGDGKSNAAYQRDLKSISTPSNERIARFQQDLDEEKYTAAQADAYMAELNTKMKDAPDSVSEFVTEGNTPNFLRERNVLSPELESYLGPVKDVGERITGTVSLLSRDNELRKADSQISQTLLDMGVLIKAGDPRFTPDLVPIQLRKGRAKIGDEELYGNPQTQAALNKIYGAKMDQASNSALVRWSSDIYSALLSAHKATKVLGNIPSYLIQIPGNAMITIAAGMNPILNAGGAFKMALGSLRGTKLGNLPILRNVADQASPVSLREFRNLQKRNLISSAVPFADIQSSLRGQKVSFMLSKALDTPGKVYSIPDNTFRLVNYANWKLELKRLMPTAPDDLIEEGAARLTTRTYPNYASVSEGIKTASRLGIGVGPFSTYGVELVRSQYQQGKVIKELANGSFAKSLGPEFAGIPVNPRAAQMLAAKKAAAMALVYGGATAAIGNANRASVSTEQETALRETVFPEYAEKKPLFIKKNDDGTFNYVNSSYYIPQTMLMAPFQAAMRGDTEEDAIGGFVQTIAEDYGGVGTFAQEALAKLYYGRDPKTGKLISSSPTAAGQAKDRLVDLVMDLRPATAKALEKDQPRGEKIARLAGIRIERTDIPTGFGFRARAIKDSADLTKSEAASAAYKLKKGLITEQEFASQLQKENENYGVYMQRMQKHVKNLQTLGENESTIIPMLKDAGFSNLESLDIMEGKFTPIDPNRRESTSEKYAKIKGKDNAETRKNIFELRKTDPLLAEKFVGIMKEEARAATLNLTAKEKLLAALPSDDKVDRLMPEIMANQNPDAYVRRLLQKRIISPQDAQAIQIRRNLNE